MTDYTKISGTRNPPKSWGDKLYVQLRNGLKPAEPWPVSTTVWKHTGSPFDVVAVKKED